LLRPNSASCFAVLLLGANHTVALDELAEAAWGADPPASARVTLQNYIKRLRLAHGGRWPFADRRRTTRLRVRVEPNELDVTRYDTQLRRARQAARQARWGHTAEQVRGAFSLWRGEPLTGVPSDLLLTRERPRFFEMHAQALEARVDADLHLGRHSEVITELRLLTAAQPLGRTGPQADAAAGPGGLPAAARAAVHH